MREGGEKNPELKGLSAAEAAARAALVGEGGQKGEDEAEQGAGNTEV